jgi:cyclopropane fatty-acyl-phospholipid synthase-like methyltransferase
MSNPGQRYSDEISEDYLDRLARNWPEPREQMHHGGWQATYDMVEALALDTADCLLDLCCGEGATARWLAKTYHQRVIGVDRLMPAIATAQHRAISEGVASLAAFQVADVFNLPFATGTFDAIYGQDADGLANHNRQAIFEECRRALRPGGRIGFQHWILHRHTPSEIRLQFDRATAESGFPSMRRLSVDDYLEDLHAAGFVEVTVDDMSHTYQEHMQAMERIADARQPGSLDSWTKNVLTLMRQGYKFGVRIRARRG